MSGRLSVTQERVLVEPSALWDCHCFTHRCITPVWGFLDSLIFYILMGLVCFLLGLNDNRGLKIQGGHVSVIPRRSASVDLRELDLSCVSSRLCVLIKNSLASFSCLRQFANGHKYLFVINLQRTWETLTARQPNNATYPLPLWKCTAMRAASTPRLCISDAGYLYIFRGWRQLYLVFHTGQIPFKPPGFQGRG